MKECPSCRRCFPDTVSACPDDGKPTTQTLAGEPLIDRYLLERRLGHGGMGIVYDARHTYLRTRHALKVILPDPNADEEQLARHVRRFHREARAVAAVNHPNVVRISDYGVAYGSMPFLVMEFVEGVSLEKMLEGGKVLAPARALVILRAVAAGVGAAHALGIVHRDLKPANIMLAGKAPAEETVKVLDFGLAKIWSKDVLGSLTLEQSHGLVGTPLYLAPEQCLEQETDERTDVYALGVVAYQMLAGRLPFNAATVLAVIKLHLEADPPPMSSRAVAVSPQVETVVRRALAKDRDQRPPSVRAFVDELAAAVAQEQAAQQADTLSLDVKAPAPGPDVPSPPAAPSSSPTGLRSWLAEFARGSALKFILFVAMIASVLPLYFSDLINSPSPTNNNLAPTPAPVWRVKQVLKGHADSVDGVAFSPDGKNLYTGGFDAKVKAWDIQTGLNFKTTEDVPDTQYLFALAVSKDGGQVVAATDNGVVSWDAIDGSFITRMRRFVSEKYLALAFSPNGERLVGGGEDETAILWDNPVPGKSTLGEEELNHGATVKAVAFSPDSLTLVSAGSDNTIKLWEVITGREKGKLLGHLAAVNAVAFSSDGKTLASADADGVIHLWDWQTGTPLRPLLGHSKAVNSLAFSPDGKTLASGSDDHTIALWNVAEGKRGLSLERHTGEVNCVAFSPDGRLLASGSRDKTVILWELAADAAPQR